MPMFTGVITQPADAPSINRCVLDAGPVAGGQSITIEGSDLQGCTVDIGGAAATSVVIADDGNSLTCVTPARTAGAKTVTVTNTKGTEAKANAFTYTAVPTISSLTPNTTANPGGGGSCTIAGTNFQVGCYVTWDGVVIGTKRNSATELVVIIPNHAAGAVNVNVTCPDAQVSANATYTYT